MWYLTAAKKLRNNPASPSFLRWAADALGDINPGAQEAWTRLILDMCGAVRSVAAAFRLLLGPDLSLASAYPLEE